MTHYKQLIDSDYLGQWDLPAGRDVVVTIAKVERYTPPVKRYKKMPDGSKKEEKSKRIAVSFVGKRKAWLAGPVSHEVLANLFGHQVENWIGKRIALYVDPNVRFGGQETGGVRCRPYASNEQPTADPLDRPVDEETARRIAAAKEGDQ